ncbi:hypothetical protein ABQH43_05690 [Streptococcus sp. ZJ100]|uniref:hypothetical protein n=1 Tax=Streptococcus handemini TaxID=3161188 RepID=UPI0032ECDF51
MTQQKTEFNTLTIKNMEHMTSLMIRLIDIVENHEARITGLTKQMTILAKAINANGGTNGRKDTTKQL